MGLAQLQEELARHIIAGDERIAARVAATAQSPARMRLGIYFQAYRTRLTAALASNVPRLKQLVGDEVFDRLARQYIGQYPSRTASIRWFGDALAQMLRELQPHEPWLAELAGWEWAIAAAFDAADREPISPDPLAHIAPEDWGALQLEFHPSARHLQMATNAPAIFKALTDGDAPPRPARLERPQSWLIWRRQLDPRYRSIDAAEAASFELARAAGTFGAICERLCDWYEPADVPGRAAAMLKHWISDAIVTNAAVGTGAGHNAV